MFSGIAKYVLLGELDYVRDDDVAQPIRFNVAERIRHPDYTSKYKYNDIALLRLNETVTFNDYIRPACLPEFSSIASHAFATGWGRTGSYRPQSEYLQKVELSLYTHKECNDLYELIKDRYINRGILNNTQICAGSYFGHGDTCQVS